MVHAVLNQDEEGVPAAAAQAEVYPPAAGAQHVVPDVVAQDKDGAPAAAAQDEASYPLLPPKDCPPAAAQDIDDVPAVAQDEDGPAGVAQDEDGSLNCCRPR